MSRSSSPSPTIVVAGQGTVSPIADALRFFSDALGWGATIETIDGGQAMPELLAKTGGLFDRQAYRVFVTSPEDQQMGSDESLPALLEALPEHNRLAIITDQTDLISSSAADILSVKRIFDDWDTRATTATMVERSLQLPYSEEGIIAIAASIARWLDAKIRPPIKYIAVDADNTLWSGILGEDGPSGLVIDDERRRFHRALKQAAADGILLSLVSKNDEQDVREYLATLDPALLQWDDFTAHHVGWGPKSAGIAGDVAKFQVAQESAAMLDDNGAELLEVAHALPGVRRVQIPIPMAQGFTDRLWLLDRPKQTEADAARRAFFQDEQARTAAYQESTSAADFFDALQLKIDIRGAATDDAHRLAQLTVRTTQFNAALTPLTEEDLLTAITNTDHEILTVRVQDRFGDYGLVGFAWLDRPTARVRQFLLSCRALGRGVEHRMLREVVKYADGTIAMQVAIGERNTPLRHFLKTVTGTEVTRSIDLPIDEERALNATFAPGQSDAFSAKSQRTDTAAPRVRVQRAPDLYTDLSVDLHSLTALTEAIKGPKRPRDMGSDAFAAPRTEIEHIISDQWSEVLRCEPIGLDDVFRDLGGRSIDLVRIHHRLEKALDRSIPLTLLFQHATVRTLAAALSEADTETVSSGRVDHQEQRTARADLAARRRAARQQSHRGR